MRAWVEISIKKPVKNIVNVALHVRAWVEIMIFWSVASPGMSPSM